MNHILQLIQEHHEWFYLITFIWAALEGETFVIFAGLAAQRGYLDVTLLFLAAALGSMFGDQVMFFVGRIFGRRIVKRFPKIQPKLDKALTALEKYSTPFVLSYRFMYGVRNISALAIGMSKLSWKRFAFLNAIASFLWSFVFCGSGYLFGDLIERFGFRDEESVNFEVRSLMIVALGIFALIVVLRIIKSRHDAEQISVSERNDQNKPTE